MPPKLGDTSSLWGVKIGKVGDMCLVIRPWGTPHAFLKTPDLLGLLKQHFLELCEVAKHQTESVGDEI